MLTLLTTTGARPEAFSLCERMMFRQAYDGPVTWIVVDDGPDAQLLSACREGWRRIVIRPEPFWRPGDNTQARNLGAGLDAAEALSAEDGAPLRLVIIEDDDWYDDRWLATVDQMLSRGDLVGEPNARYYNAAMRRGSYLNNAFHASLRASAMKGEGISALRRALTEFSTFYDFKMWADPAPSKYLSDTALTVGVKGLPGRPGIAAGHREMAGYADPDLTLLRRWIGDDADHYARFFREDAMSLDRTTMYATGKLKKYENRMLVAGEPFACKNKDLRVVRAMSWGTDEPPAAADPAPQTGADPVAATVKDATAPAPDLLSEGPAAEDHDGPKFTDDQAPENDAAPLGAEVDEAEPGTEETAPKAETKRRKPRGASSKTAS